MRQILGASLGFMCDESFSIQRNIGVVVKKGKITQVGEYQALCREFSDLKHEFFDGCVLLPAFVNAHLHFEFSGNAVSFTYGDFGAWLDSVIANRDVLLGMDTLDKHICDCIDECLRSGVGIVGAVSSYGYDLKMLAQSPLRVVFFNEAIGSNPSAIDTLYRNFCVRLEESQSYASSSFIPAVALHSPYSLHHIFAKRVVEIARRLDSPMSVHFLESIYEREWLENASGYFYKFFTQIFQLPNPKPFYTITNFLEFFSDIKNAIFVHCLQARDKELEFLKQNTFSIVTCPRSNRLLCNDYLDLQNPNLPNVALGTDGKSSNNNLNMLEELRTALFGYKSSDLESLAKKLLLFATSNGAKALDIQSGEIKVGKNADLALFHIPELSNLHNPSQIPLHFILQAKSAHRVYIDGIRVL